MGASTLQDRRIFCLKCRYNLTGLTSDRCPECGWLVDWEKVDPDFALAQVPFFIDFARRLSPDRIKLAWVDDETATSPELEALVESNWQAKLAEARQSGRRLFNGPMVRLVGWQCDGTSVTFTVGPTDYRRHLGTNYLLGNRVEEVGIAAFANPVGTSANIITSDGYLLFGRRASDLACHAGYLHCIGGTLDLGDNLDLFAAMRREIREELLVSDAEILDLTCTGMVRDKSIHQPEVLFDSSLGLSKDEVMSRFDPQAEGQEHTGWLYCHDDPESVPPFLESADLMAPVAQAAAILHGRHDWGMIWYESACFRMFGEMPAATPIEKGGRP